MSRVRWNSPTSVLRFHDRRLALVRGWASSGSTYLIVPCGLRIECGQFLAGRTGEMEAG